ncbi:Vasoactive intestinal polypeptide receptor 1 [Chelonia mydas]|uniref:Vasoactive intestinal polypeptide receptor 1 n=1 Tax=Chelonia mydas TaxID=8469 RepID=M7AVM3_CHEMY|nr:Vasoactive intestinal polypeptide receptor 1 [Chelonia mydas]
MRRTWQPFGVWQLLLLLVAIPLTPVQMTHPECSIILHLQEREAECLETIRSENQSNESPEPSSWKGRQLRTQIPSSDHKRFPVGHIKTMSCSLAQPYTTSRSLTSIDATSGWLTEPYATSCSLTQPYATLCSLTPTNAKSCSPTQPYAVSQRPTQPYATSQSLTQPYAMSRRLTLTDRRHIPQVTTALRPADTALRHVPRADTTLYHVRQPDIALRHILQSDSGLRHVLQPDTALRHVPRADTALRHVLQPDTALRHVLRADTALRHVLQANSALRHGAYFATVKVLYTCGYSASLAALLLAIGIFSCFRKLHCTRNSIHIHFFTSFIMRGAAVFIKDSVLFADESINHCTMSTVNCKAAIAFFQYSVLANFYWLLVEGMYLQTLLLFTFTSDKRYFWWYTLIGWGAPLLIVSLWIFARLQYDNHGCWDDYASLYWWVIKAPILFAIFMNFLIFLNVIRMLVQKIRSPDVGKNYKQQYMRLAKSTLLLIPLFGVHYVVFALFPEHIGVEARLYFELVLGSYQGFLVALLYCFLNGEVQAEIRRNWGKWQSSMESNVFNLVTQDFTA